jgi:hypothetical protein
MSMLKWESMEDSRKSVSRSGSGREALKLPVP